MAVPVLDHARSEAFAGRMMEVLNGAGITLMMSIGHQVGLFDAMAGRPPATSEQIAAAARSWSAAYNKVPEDNGSYTIVHSAYVYLMDADNRLAGTLGFQESEAEQLTKLKALLARRGAGK